MTCCEEIRHLHLLGSPNPMGQLGMVLMYHMAEVFLEKYEKYKWIEGLTKFKGLMQPF